MSMPFPVTVYLVYDFHIIKAPHRETWNCGSALSSMSRKVKMKKTRTLSLTKMLIMAEYYHIL